MGTLFRNNFSKGWTPNEDEHNGDPTGLLRADNLLFDEEGVVRLSRGTAKVDPSHDFASAGFISAIYSVPVHGDVVGSANESEKVRYVHCINGTTYRNWGASNTEFNWGGVLSGGDADTAAFGSGWGQTFICSGPSKRQDSGPVSSWRDLGIVAGNAPGYSVNAPPSTVSDTNFPFTNWIKKEGATFNASSNMVQIQVDPTTFRGLIQSKADDAVATWDCTNINGTGKDQPNDIFNMLLRPQDIGELIKVRVELLLQTPPSATTPPGVTDFFWHEWYKDSAVETNPNYLDPDIYNFADTKEFMDRVKQNLEPGISFDSFFREGQNFWGSIQCLRNQFKRSGTDDSLSWANVKAVRIAVITASQIDFYFGTLSFIGGTDGQLNGWYSYKQVNCYDNGSFVEVGLDSAETPAIQVIKSSVHITPIGIPGNVNRVRIYRSSTQTPGFYLVKEQNDASAFDDVISDVDALRINMPLEYYRSALPDGIRTIIGPYYDRMLYFDFKTLFPSYQYDPGTYDSRHSMDICSDTNEVIMWAKVVIDGVILVGTTKDIYQVQGNFTFDEATQLLNVSVTPLGINQPPISFAAAVYETTLFYLAENGWKAMQGSTVYSISGPLSLLYLGYSRHGVPVPRIGARNRYTVDCCVSKNRLICTLETTANSRELHVFDLERKVWTRWVDTINPNSNPCHIFTEADGNVIFASNGYTGTLFLYNWDIGSTLASGTAIPLTLRTVYDNDGKPNNRKDLLTLKVTGDTGGVNTTITVRAYEDTITPSAITFIFNSNGRSTQYFRLDYLQSWSPSIGAPKKIQFEITGTCSTFKLYEFTVEYQERPTQTNYLRLPPANFNIAGRKRVPHLPLELDTLGNTVTFVPIVDTSAQTSSTFTASDKTTFTHYFTSDIVGYDFGGYLYCSSGVFEFYGLITPREVEQLPDPLKYKRIVNTNFGVAAKKRVPTWPFILDTKGGTVTFTPELDGSAQSTATFSTTGKRTCLHYFPTGVFGIDYGGYFTSSTPFELYEMLKPEVIEVLPVGKMMDQVGPIDFNRQARIRGFRVRLLADSGCTSITWNVYGEDVSQVSGTITPNVGYEQVYEVSLPKGVLTTVFKLTLTGNGIFHRFKVYLKVNVTGADTDLKWKEIA